ncbi:SDR family oxidoreductase [Tunturibacter psychrotolerans]|uniref:SDR family oxidoreductase n=1 Tax=Tunturiibacter psychrotolerans TaxID=3069686 RepID=A0AAU7ZWL1_9BACT
MVRPVALISGVSRTASIGAAVARKLATGGWDLALTYWAPCDERMPWGAHPEDLENLKVELLSTGSRVVFIASDLEQSHSASGLFGKVTAELGPVSALVLSHCESVGSSIMDTTLESFERHFAVNVRASWQLIQQLAVQTPESGGRIVALTSDDTVGNLPYGASKGALDRIVLAAARELAHLNITSNAVNPGPIDTGWMDDQTRISLTQRQPTGRLGTAADAANLIAFLLSPEGSWINGQLIKSDGGISA